MRQRLDRLTHKQIRSHGLSFDYFEAGQSESSVLLLHGIGSGAASWVYQLEALSDRYHVIAWNAPGYGRSTALAMTRPKVGDYAQALKTFCDVLGLAQVHLVGQSLGALFSAAFSQAYPQQVTTMTLLNPARGHAREEIQVREFKRAERLRLMAELGPEEHAQQRAPLQLSLTPAAEALALVRWNLAQLNPDGYAQAAQVLADTHLPDHADYAGPVQILSGTADRIMPTAAACETARAYPQAQFHTLPELGHAAYAEGPELVNRYLRQFFAALA